MDWSLEGAWCISKAEWIAKFKITAQGGTGTYTYYRDTDKICGPTNSNECIYELKYGASSAAVGSFTVKSGTQSAKKDFWVKHPDCSGY